MTDLNQLQILQSNLHKNKERTHAILSDPDTQDFAVIMLQEQYWSTYTSSSPHHHAWTLIEPTTYDTLPRTAIYINNRKIAPIKIAPVPIPINDITAIEVSLSNLKPPSLLINIYNAPESQVILEFQRYATQNIRPEKYEFILIGGDFNLHHPLWNPAYYYRHDDNADILIDTMSNLNLNLLLPPGTITYPNAGTAIDLVWGNAKVEHALIRCTIADEDFGSDHLPIKTEIATNSVPQISRPYHITSTKLTGKH